MLTLLTAAVALASGATSAYTTLDLKRCVVLERGTEDDWSVWRCPGYRGIPLIVAVRRYSGAGRMAAEPRQAIRDHRPVGPPRLPGRRHLRQRPRRQCSRPPRGRQNPCKNSDLLPHSLIEPIIAAYDARSATCPLHRPVIALYPIHPFKSAPPHGDVRPGPFLSLPGHGPKLRTGPHVWQGAPRTRARTFTWDRVYQRAPGA